MATSQKSGIAGVATRFAGKAALRTADTLADSSFDARKIGGVGKELGIGEGRKGGVKTIIADQKKRDDEMLKLIGTRDLTTPEAQQEVAARAAEITEREQTKKAELQSMRTVMANDKNKSPERLRQEINDLDARIAQMKLELNDAQQKQTLTPKELAAKQKEIKDAEVTITQKRQFEATNKVYNEKSAAIQERDEKLRTDTTLSEQDKAKLRAEREQLEDELQGINNAIQKNDQTLESAIKEAEQNLAKAADVAAAEVKYGNRIAYLKNMERSANFWRNPATGLLGGGASTTASGLATANTAGYGLGFSAATAGTVAGVAGIAAIAAAKQSAIISSAVKAELEKQYGKDALEMAKKDKQSEEEKRLARQLRELEKRQGGGGGDDAKKDDKKDDD